MIHPIHRWILDFIIVPFCFGTCIGVLAGCVTPKQDCEAQGGVYSRENVTVTCNSSGCPGPGYGYCVYGTQAEANALDTSQ